MSKRQARDVGAWMRTEAGQAKYRAARADAQRRANETGLDHQLVRNDVFAEFTICMLPEKRNRYGRDLDGEVVSCESLDRTRAGHGVRS